MQGRYSHCVCAWHALDGLYKFPLQAAADIVSAGGFPKDINMYQAQKALDNARFAVREGGVIILVAACGEGYGSTIFERWMREATSPEHILHAIQESFELGGHKAAAIALTLQKVKIFCISDMPDDMVKNLFFEPYKTLEEAFTPPMHYVGVMQRYLLCLSVVLPCLLFGKQAYKRTVTKEKVLGR